MTHKLVPVDPTEAMLEAVRASRTPWHAPFVYETMLAAAPEPPPDPRDALIEQLAYALSDMQAGWRYIREVHGDLYGVGWERCETSSTDALAAVRAWKEGK